jgi:hypothetical protein
MERPLSSSACGIGFEEGWGGVGWGSFLVFQERFLKVKRVKIGVSVKWAC